MEIRRDAYLQKLIDRRGNGLVKVITGIRRCGKSYLLRQLFRDHLLATGVPPERIIQLELDRIENLRFRNPLELAAHIRQLLGASAGAGMHYLFIDEIQLVEAVKNPYLPDGKKITFYDVLNDFAARDNVDIYVTGSNSKMLSNDILTEFRGRGDEIRLHPLTFAEFYAARGADREAAWREYAFFGGMPLILGRADDGDKMAYLQSLFSELYLKDIVERKKIEYPDELGEMLDLLCSSVGSLTNPTKIANTIRSRKNLKISPNTLKSYLGHLQDSFLFCECKRFDVRGKSYFDYPMKYYCEDVGLRNARIGFRQMEMPHIMENVVCNELRARGFAVDIGVVYEAGRTANNSRTRSQREIDFIATRGNRKFYLQSAFAMPSAEKAMREAQALDLAGDSFPKIIVRRDVGKAWYDEKGVLNIDLLDFLLDPEITR